MTDLTIAMCVELSKMRSGNMLVDHARYGSSANRHFPHSVISFIVETLRRQGQDRPQPASITTTVEPSKVFCQFGKKHPTDRAVSSHEPIGNHCHVPLRWNLEFHTAGQSPG